VQIEREIKEVLLGWQINLFGFHVGIAIITSPTFKIKEQNTKRVLLFSTGGIKRREKGDIGRTQFDHDVSDIVTIISIQFQLLPASILY